MGRRSGSTPRRALSAGEVDALLTKLRAPQAGVLSETDRGALVGIVETWAHLIEVAANKSIGMPQIRRLLGLEQARRAEPAEPTAASASSGTNEDVTNPSSGGDRDAVQSTPASDPKNQPLENRDAHGRRGAGAFPKIIEVHHGHTSLHSGDGCPDCDRGRVYKYRPSEFTTISGQSPLVATRHTVDTLQCNLCKAVFKAPVAEVWVDDGIDERTLYTYSAVAMVCTYRFFAGMPMHRQDRLQRALGVPVPDASIWDMCERQADVLRPIARALHGLAKDSILFFGDDTGATILDTRTKVKKNRKSGVASVRTGCHTTCVIAVTREDRAISLFATGIHHTGEVMDLVLADRDPALSAPLFMGDCISSNTVTATHVIYAGCNSHAVRKFKDVADRYPEHADFALERYKQIYENDKLCRTQAMTAENRRDYHEAHSRPILRAICEYGQDILEQRRAEPNSDLGAAFRFVIDNERRLSAFTRHPHAPLDNNRCERELRICVRLRETAHFFKNAIGAGVADTILTVGATALAANVTLPDYFQATLRHASDVRAHPELWLPWCYQQRAEQLARARNDQLRGPDPPSD